MRYIVTALCVLLVSVGSLGQSTRQAKKIPDIRILSFSEYRYIKNKVTQRVLSAVDLSDRDTSIIGLGLYDKVIFCDKISRRTTFLDSCFFFYCYFVNSDFSNISFNSFVDFNNSFFFEKSTFSGSRFKETASFINATFDGDGPFNFVRFEKEVTFENAKFSNHTSFSNTKFGGNVSFNQVVFHENLDFQKVTCNAGMDFSEAQLPTFIYFYNTSFEYDDLTDISSKIDFRRSRLDTLQARIKGAKCSIQFDDTDVDRFLLPYDRFLLMFGQGTTYEQKISAYESIIKNCREAGMNESARDWDIDYRRLQNVHNYWFLGFGHLVNLFNWVWWNFGYAKWRILVIWLPFFFLFFLAYNYIALNRLWGTMYKDNELGKAFLKRHAHTAPPVQYGWERFAFAFFYTAVIYFGFKIRHEAVNYKNTRGLLYLYTMYAVGTLHMAFAFSYIISAY
ncbi:pentapeptide repeat-containing protein [Spirosoma sordidisoli]|uniref:Pentapeptide repeat-containing protein n=1 Tax=Spirosoma sordidisoli TaxID=2502893 RepID=A0A4Q2UT71_9BACT|nr:pentapeptide repeat-containing protein [Spirosoma sordidisoli]RYC70019.1 hypothetical protein EQG79_09110 [Spirosoma sordidisoli]